MRVWWAGHYFHFYQNICSPLINTRVDSGNCRELILFFLQYNVTGRTPNNSITKRGRKESNQGLSCLPCMQPTSLVPVPGSLSTQQEQSQALPGVAQYHHHHQKQNKESKILRGLPPLFNASQPISLHQRTCMVFVSLGFQKRSRVVSFSMWDFRYSQPKDKAKGSQAMFGMLENKDILNVVFQAMILVRVDECFHQKGVSCKAQGQGEHLQTALST